MAKMGITTAETAKPMATQAQLLPALKPKKGGSIKFPAPKNRENKANATRYVCLV
jgi:hypothetical protein